MASEDGPTAGGPEPGDPAWTSYEPGAPGAASDSPPPLTHVPYGGSAPHPTYAGRVSSRRQRNPVARLIVVAAVALVLATTGFSIVKFAGGIDTIGDTFGDTFDNEALVPDVPAEPPPPDVLSPHGWTDLVQAVRKRQGDTVVFEAVLYPEYASVDVPVDGRTQREQSLFWNGELGDSLSQGTSQQQRIDLADVQAKTLLRLIRKAKALVEDPDGSYVIIQGASTNPSFEDEPRIVAYASNEYEEGGYVIAGLDGKISSKHTY